MSFSSKHVVCMITCTYIWSDSKRTVLIIQKNNTVMPRYNAVVGRHLLGPPYKRGALWDPVDLFDIIIPRRSKGQAKLPRLEVELV